MSTSTLVSRFAPSPTGYLHVGGARTALFAWLLAKHSGGKFLLRIEDTDLARSTEQATTQLLEDLRWLGLHWDNDQLVFQSKRVAIYNELLEKLIAQGKAYKAYETREELDAMRKEAEKKKQQFVYRRGPVDAQMVAKYESEGRPHVVRFAMPVKDYRYTDAVLGEILFPSAEVQDFVIRKTDGMPTFHFAVVVDDEAMGVTHVMRGQEHVKNTFNHVALQDALGYRQPIFAHLSTIQNPDASKMGKRDRDKAIRQRTTEWIKSSKQSAQDLASASSLAISRLEAWLKDSKQQLDLPEQESLMCVIGLSSSDLPEILVHDFRKNGYLPEALLNFLVLLGWSPGGNKEYMSMPEMIELFSIERINKANPKFDRVKLLAFNTEIAAGATSDRLVAAMRDYLSVNPDSPLNTATDAQLAMLLEMKKGFRLLRDVDHASQFLFIADDKIQYDPIAVDKVLVKQDQQGAKVLRDLIPILSSTEWNAHTLEAAIQKYAETSQLGLGKVAQPIRVAISGSTVSPPIFQSLEMLGKERTMTRIARCLPQIA